MRKQKILVVDDEPDLQMLILQKFRKQIQDDLFEFSFAENGEEALQMLNGSDGISLVLSDINMPKMDGLTFLTELQKLNYPALKTVIVSAYGDMDNIRTAMNRGAFDFVTKPIDFKDLEITIQKTLKEIAALREAMDERQRLQSVQRDLDTAARIQQKILPRVFPPFPDRQEFDVYAEMLTAKEVGGDFYDFFFIDNDKKKLGFLIGDVSGKGVPAAIYMAVSRTMIKSLAKQIHDPGECLQTVNELLIPESDAATFLTVFYGVLDTETGEVTYCNGGHNNPYLVSKEKGVSQCENTDGVLLGKIPGMSFGHKTVQLNPGERLVLYTDGVTEAENDVRDMYEEERFEKFLSSSLEKPLQQLIKGIILDTLKFVGKRDQSDDITLLGIEYKGK